MARQKTLPLGTVVEVSSAGGVKLSKINGILQRAAGLGYELTDETTVASSDILEAYYARKQRKPSQKKALEAKPQQKKSA